jgi:hypothetical protein
VGLKVGCWNDKGGDRCALFGLKPGLDFHDGTFFEVIKAIKIRLWRFTKAVEYI